MVWIIKDDDEGDFYDSLAAAPDRVVGILCSTIIEDRLKDAIRSRWYNFSRSDYKLHDRLFGEGGALFNFGACVEIAFAIGLVGEMSFLDLRNISKIRNFFAHKLPHKDFAHTQIKSLTMNLSAPDRFPIAPGPRPDVAGALLASSSVSDVSDPRQRFIRAAEIYSGLLYVASVDTGEITMPEPFF